MVTVVLIFNIRIKAEENMRAISEKLEAINLQLAKRSESRIRIIRYLFIAFAAMNSVYLNWDYSNPELAIAGTILNGLEFIFVNQPLVRIEYLRYLSM